MSFRGFGGGFAEGFLVLVLVLVVVVGASVRLRFFLLWFGVSVLLSGPSSAMFSCGGAGAAGMGIAFV
jgi:hypothetical protein